MAKRFFVMGLVVATLVLASVGWGVARADEESGTEWNAVLAGKNERPVPRDTNARGIALFELNPDGMSVHYKLIVANIQNVVMAHIHLGNASVAGPVIVWLYPVTGPPPAAPGGGRVQGVLAEGDFNATKFVGPFAGKPLGALLENMTAGTVYVNVHTDDGVAPADTGPGDFPAGEIRGQIKVADDS